MEAQPDGGTRKDGVAQGAPGGTSEDSRGPVNLKNQTEPGHLDTRLNQHNQKRKYMKKSLLTLVITGTLMLAALVLLLHLFPHIMAILVALALFQLYRMLQPMINPGRPGPGHCGI